MVRDGPVDRVEEAVSGGAGQAPGTGYLPIAEHGMIGDLHAVALVGTDGTTPDGLGGKEATFSMCSFWWVEALARAGRLHEARLAFEKMLTYGNHLGLYAEEIGHTGEQLGNFPQAFTHLALISAAFNLDRALG